MHRFGDTGTAKIGYQFSDSGYSQSNSYVPLFFATGPNAASNISNEGVAQFQTGDRFAPFRNLIVADAQLGSGNFQGNSYQYTVTNRLGYVVNHEITVYGEIGYEDDLYYAHTEDPHQRCNLGHRRHVGTESGQPDQHQLRPPIRREQSSDSTAHTR